MKVKHLALPLIILTFTSVVLNAISLKATAQDTTHRIGSTLQASARPSAPSPTPAPSASPAASPAPAPAPAATQAQAPAPAANPSALPTQLAPLTEVAIVPDRIIRVEVKAGPHGIPQFNPPRVEVTAGQQIEVILRNNEDPNSGVTHNWVLIKPGTESAVAALGKEAGVDPDAVTYSPSILAATRTTRPGSEGIVDFLAPETPGTYPFISLVGNQRNVLRGALVVKPIG